MRLLAVFVLVCGLLAGCLADDGSDPGDDPQQDAQAIEPFSPPVPDFDFTSVVDSTHAQHSVASFHTAGHGLDLIGHAGLGEILPPTTRGSITSVDIHGDYAVVAGMEGGLAFAIVDLSDRSDPKAVGWAPSAADGWTARFSADGNTVFYGCQMLGATGSATANVYGTCEDPTAVHPPGSPASQVPVENSNPGGVSAWDVTDKTDPRFLDFLPVGGSHNIYAQAIDGVDYIFTASTAIVKWDNATKTLEQVAEVPGRHDQTVIQHPVSGDWLLFVGTAELTIWNVNDPSDPQLVYEPADGEDVPWTGWHDQVAVPGLVDGRAILLLAGETGVYPGGGEAPPPDVVSIVDITNPVKPALLSKWSPPFTVPLPYASYLYSVHEMSATPTGQVSIAWYHAGVWVIDVSTRERQEGAALVAAYQPHEDIDITPSTFAQTPLPFVPFVWSAAWMADGHLVVPDMHTGVYVLEPEWGLHPAYDGGQ
jgi:hypothetical protein